MVAKASGSFEVTSWVEETYDESDDGSRRTKASVTQRCTGGIEGDASVQWLMVHRPDGTAHFAGLQHVLGTLAGRNGSFTLATVGEFDGTMATWRATVVPRSGTGDLQGLTGSGTFGAPPGSKATFELHYEFT